MPRSSEQTRSRILEAAYRQFWRKGFSRVSMDDIAAAAGVTKRSLYYHYDSKDALLGAVLEEQHGLALAAFSTFGQPDGSPEQVVGGLFDQLAAWTAKPHFAASGFTRLAMELADLPGHPARTAARRHKQMLEGQLARALEAAGAISPRQKARQVCLLMEGAAALVLIHGDQDYVEAAGTAAKALTGGR